MTIPEILDWARKKRMLALGNDYKENFSSDKILDIRDYLKMLIEHGEVVATGTTRINASMNHMQDAIDYLKKCGVVCPGNVREEVKLDTITTAVPSANTFKPSWQPIKK